MCDKEDHHRHLTGLQHCNTYDADAVDVFCHLQWGACKQPFPIGSLSVLAKESSDTSWPIHLRCCSPFCINYNQLLKQVDTRRTLGIRMHASVLQEMAKLEGEGTVQHCSELRACGSFVCEYETLYADDGEPMEVGEVEEEQSESMDQGAN